MNLTLHVHANQVPITQAARIISLAPHLTEMVYSAGAGKQLVGVINYSNFPKQALNKPIIGDYNAINLEKIIELKPNIILAWRSGNRMQDFERLKSLQAKQGFQIIETEIKTLHDIPNLIQTIGKFAGTPKHAKQTANKLRRILKELKHFYHTQPKISVFYQIWDKPLITMGKDQFISQGISLCAGQNIFEDLKALTGQVALETIMMRNPEVILLGGTAGQQALWQKNWQRYPLIDAVKNKRVYNLENAIYQRPTQRFIEALPQLCRLLHPSKSSINAPKNAQN